MGKLSEWARSHQLALFWILVTIVVGGIALDALWPLP